MIDLWQFSTMRFFTPGVKAQPPVKAVVESPQGQNDNEKEAGLNTQDQQNVDTDTDTISSDVQAGVKDMEAITSVWSTSHLILAYAL